MTLLDLLEYAKAQPETAPVHFTANGKGINAGFHITELKHAKINSIDCGGNEDQFDEVTLQLLDGYGGLAMSSGKLAKILAHSLKAIPALENKDLRVEFAPENNGLHIYHMEDVTVVNERLTIALTNGAAVCKPAQRASSNCDCQKQTACC